MWVLQQLEQREEERKMSFAVPLDEMLKGFDPKEVEYLQALESEQSSRMSFNSELIYR